MTKSTRLARYVRATAELAKSEGHTIRVYGLDRITSYGFVSKEGSFWPLNEDPTNEQLVRLIANTIGMNTHHSKDNRKAVLNAINYFRKGA